jgi:hypothetical protein
MLQNEQSALIPMPPRRRWCMLLSMLILWFGLWFYGLWFMVYGKRFRFKSNLILPVIIIQL